MKYYVAYGSNLHIGQMMRRCPDAKIVGKSFIKDYKLLFKGSVGASFLTIERSIDSIVPVGVWSVSDKDEKALDIYEGFPSFYYKKDIDIVIDGNVLKSFVYIMHESNKLAVPSKHYVDICKTGYEDFEMDPKYLLEALNTSCVSSRFEPIKYN